MAVRFPSLWKSSWLKGLSKKGSLRLFASFYLWLYLYYLTKYLPHYAFTYMRFTLLPPDFTLCHSYNALCLHHYTYSSHHFALSLPDYAFTYMRFTLLPPDFTLYHSYNALYLHHYTYSSHHFALSFDYCGFKLEVFTL